VPVIGTDSTGKTGAGTLTGVRIEDSPITLSGALWGAANVISDNTTGVLITGAKRG